MTLFEQYITEPTEAALIEGLAQLAAAMTTGKLPKSQDDGSIGNSPLEAIEIFRQKYPDVELSPEYILEQRFSDRVDEILAESQKYDPFSALMRMMNQAEFPDERESGRFITVPGCDNPNCGNPNCPNYRGRTGQLRSKKIGFVN